MSDISLLSPKQLYHMLNESLDTPIGVNAVYRLMKSKDFPALRIGGRLYAIESEVKAWLLNQIKKTH